MAVKERMRRHGAEHRRSEHLQHRARHGNALHAQQILDGEMQPDAEHQQHHAHF